MFRVNRRTLAKTQWGNDDEYVIWEGEDPFMYLEGVGCYDEPDEYIWRWFQELKPEGWVDIKDPRKKY